MIYMGGDNHQKTFNSIWYVQAQIQIVVSKGVYIVKMLQ